MSDNNPKARVSSMEPSYRPDGLFEVEIPGCDRATKAVAKNIDQQIADGRANLGAARLRARIAYGRAVAANRNLRNSQGKDRGR